MDELVAAISVWFDANGWTIEKQSDNHIVAVMSSGYGSGPAVVDITMLCHACRAVKGLTDPEQAS